MTVLGSKLPEPYFTLAITPGGMGFRRFRRCTVCHHVSTTVELPMAPRGLPSPGDCCPVHSRTKGVTLKTISPAAAVGQNILGQGVLKAISLGAVWRRRGCGQNYNYVPRQTSRNWYLKEPEYIICRHPLGNGPPTRWSTIEVDSSGVIVKDVSLCPNCGGRTRSYRGTKQRAEDWRLENRWK